MTSPHSTVTAARAKLGRFADGANEVSNWHATRTGRPTHRKGWQSDVCMRQRHPTGGTHLISARLLVPVHGHAFVERLRKDRRAVRT